MTYKFRFESMCMKNIVKQYIWNRGVPRFQMGFEPGSSKSSVVDCTTELSSAQSKLRRRGQKGSCVLLSYICSCRQLLRLGSEGKHWEGTPCQCSGDLAHSGGHVPVSDCCLPRAGIEPGSPASWVVDSTVAAHSKQPVRCLKGESDPPGFFHLSICALSLSLPYSIINCDSKPLSRGLSLANQLF